MEQLRAGIVIGLAVFAVALLWSDIVKPTLAGAGVTL